MERAELVRRARDGDRDAYDILVTESIDAMYRVARIENDEGAWHGSTSRLTMPGGVVENSVIVLTGEGAYEGLTAVLYSFEGGCFFDYRGIVTEIPDPPVPYTGN